MSRRETTTSGEQMETLSADEIWRLLARRRVGRLVVCADGLPDVFPVNYAVDGDTIVIKTAPGLKLAAAVLGEGVAFEVDSFDETRHTGWSVVLRGPAREIEDRDELLAADRLHIDPWSPGPKNRYLRIEPDVATGRRIGEATPVLHLAWPLGRDPD
ncbi:MAG: pyridoxamine 5'-phosphate oxidase family protein [Actinomycetota bacterium]